MKNEDTKTKPRLLWVKIMPEHSKALAEQAAAIGVSRADYMRLILIDFLTNKNTITINNNTNAK
jgi:hypothetical protein